MAEAAKFKFGQKVRDSVHCVVGTVRGIVHYEDDPYHCYYLRPLAGETHTEEALAHFKEQYEEWRLDIVAE